MDFTDVTIDDNYLSSEEMLQGLDSNIDISVGRGDVHEESTQGGVSPANGLPGGQRQTNHPHANVRIYIFTANSGT